MDKKKGILILVILVVLFFAVNYGFMDNQLEQFFTESEYANVSRIIDGDTIEIATGESVRLLGINTPERGERYYEEASEFLSELVLDEEVKLEFIEERYDKYGRLLAYVFLGNINANAEIIKAGFANYYFYSGKDKYSNELEQAWKGCITNGENLCEASASSCSSCVKIVNTKTITNTCDFSCDISDWTIKGEGREKFIFNETIFANEEKEFELDLTDSSGSLYLRDNEGKLVLWTE